MAGQPSLPTVKWFKKPAWGGLWITIPLAVLSVGFIGLALIRLFDLAVGRHLLAVTALTPYIALAGALLGLLALVVRRWSFGVVVLLVTAVLGVLIVPRAVSDTGSEVQGTKLALMSINTLAGIAEAEPIVAAVKQHQIDVLALQELTPGMVRDLERAGLNELLPHQVLLDEPGGSGSGLASRFPLHPKLLTQPSSLRQAGAEFDLAGTNIQLVSVHPMPPVIPDGPLEWETDLRGLPARDANGPIRILAGDFNATLDHAQLRDVLAGGYQDAAEQVGHGLTPTWPHQDKILPLLVQIDHFLVDDRCAVNSFTVVPISGTDHRAIITTLTVPT